MKRKTILYVLVLLIIAICNFLVIKFVFIPNNGIGSCKVEVGEINANYGKKGINITSIDTNVDIGDGKKYARIGIKVTDANNSDALMDAYLFEVIDRNKQTIAMCQTGAISDNEKMKDILPAHLSANGSISGYLYCETNREDINFLKISYVSEAKYDKEGNVKPDSKVLYINFK